MRKKIFIIHGRGVVNGLGTEGGGDLDTVASNTFYAVWTRGLIKKDEGREAEYGRDYEFDFVNYQAGLSHLKIHKGCDLYLPDFPVDALSPRLKLLLLESEEDVKIRNRAFQVLDAFKQNIYSHASLIDNDLKELYNSLINKVRSYYSDYSKYEVALLSELFSFFHCMISLIPLMSEKTKISANSLVLQFKSFFSGINFRLLRDEMGELLGNRIFENLKDKYIKKEPAPVKAFNDLKKEHLSSSFKVKISDNLIVMLIESCNFLRKIKLFISKYGKVLDRTDIRDLTGILSSSAELVNKEMTRFILFINELKIKDPKAIKIFNVFKGNLKNCMRVFALLKNIKDTGKPNKIVLMLIEEESLSGVENVDITFSKIKGDVNFISNGKKLKGSKVDLKTNKNGGCSISVGGSTSRPYYISITFNELNYLVYTNIENKEDLRLIEEGSDEYHVSDQKDTGEILSEEEEASIEKGESPTRALKVSLQMIEKDFKILKKNDVRMIRIDDHHPWTKEILDLLNKLKDQGYIMENITMSGPNRLAKEEQPKSVQKCGTDLIYESLIKDTGLDNPGYRRLCTLAHLQDLHIKEDNLAIEISKLIGSGYSKIKMAEMLSRVRSKQDIKNIMARNQWTRLVQEYEDSLADVLPRIEKNIIKVSLLKKPEGNDHSKGLGLFGLLKPFLFLYRNREDLVKRLYALNKKNRVDIFMVLSPFTDKKAGEVKINVASAINYLRRSYRMDYIFYCYGSMLMTTRRVGKTGAPINLSSLVAYIGTKADGGHPEAATGKPSSNPSFPEELFEKVNDSNFYEYVFYITQKVAAFTDRDIFDIREVRIRQYEQIIESSLHELEGSLLYLNFKTIQSSDSRKEPKKILLVKNTGGLNISTAINYLAYRKKYEMDYLFFTRGSERLIVRNINDPSQSIDINKCVKLIGSENDKGFLKAGIAFPRNNKEFPADDFKYINTFNICEYAFYLKERMKGYSGLKFINIEEVQQKNSSPVHKNRLLQIQNTLWRTVINYKGRNYNISYAFSPVTAS
ncbi:MAG: hypothetical protein KKH98_05770, partial [Spirochaetes bacterium]|nr:hypothetical protein [Spirochaetota bacterium]